MADNMYDNMNKESDDVREMRESIEQMEQDLKGMEQDIEEVKNCPDPEIREVALRGFEQMQNSTREIVASFRKLYEVVRESDAMMAELSDEEEA